jgi:hypothetical protein
MVVAVVVGTPSTVHDGAPAVVVQGSAYSAEYYCIIGVKCMTTILRVAPVVIVEYFRLRSQCFFHRGIRILHG